MRSFWHLGVRMAAAVMIAGLAPRVSAQGFDKWGHEGKERINHGTIGLAAGLPEGAPLRFAAEIARASSKRFSARLKPSATVGYMLSLSRPHSPGDVEHRLGEKDDEHDVSEDARVDEPHLARPELAARAQRHGGNEMDQHADRQKDLEPK